MQEHRAAETLQAAARGWRARKFGVHIRRITSKYVEQNRQSVFDAAQADDSLLAISRYKDTKELEDQLRPKRLVKLQPKEIVPVRLLRGSWLIKQAEKQRQGIPHRKVLEQDEPEAFLGDDSLHSVLAEVNVNVTEQSGKAVMRYPPIIAVSYAWHGKEHPDPDGSLLAMLAPILEWYLSERAKLLPTRPEVTSHDVGVFLDFWSLHQQTRTSARDEWEEGIFQGALSSMDAWFAHAGTVTLLMTALPAAWGEVPEERRFEGRGWCFFERQVASLAKVGTHVLDGGFFDRDELARRYPNAASIGDGSFASKGAEALAKQATGEDVAHQDFLSRLIMSSRQGPLHPEVFPEALESKAFSFEDDRTLTTNLFNAVAHGVVRSTHKASFSHLDWGRDDFASLGKTLTLWDALVELRLNNSRMDAECLGALLQGMSADALPKLQELQIKDNPLGDEGMKLMAEALQAGRLRSLRVLLLRSNGQSSEGERALQAACEARGVSPTWDNDRQTKEKQKKGLKSAANSILLVNREVSRAKTKTPERDRGKRAAVECAEPDLTA